MIVIDIGIEIVKEIVTEKGIEIANTEIEIEVVIENEIVKEIDIVMATRKNLKPKLVTIN